MNIGLDMMGGDFAPSEAVKGVKLYLEQLSVDSSQLTVNSQLKTDNRQPSTANLLTLFGDQPQIEALLKEHNVPQENIRIVHTSQVIAMEEHPTKALREKQDSSIAVGFGYLAKGLVDAFISAGNTGAMMVGSLFSIKAIEGIQRPTIGAYMPRENGKLGWLLDAGINSDCKPENLVQFAMLGSIFAEHILGFENPKVGLINIGEEEGKGNILCQAAYPLLKEEKSINFIGNIEGRDVFLDKADVMVCEGYTGNIILKLAESIHGLVQRRNVHDEFFDMFEFEQYGGVPVLGVNKPVIIGHGISHGKAFMNMINIAQKMIEKDVIGKIKQQLTGLPAGRQGNS
jgi:glycerol-3-phosphate acyltransferase PlsX